MSNAVVELKPWKRVSFAKSDIYQSLAFDANGQLFLTRIDRRKRLIVDDFASQPVLFDVPQIKKYIYPTVQRFADGRWLVVAVRSHPDDLSATVLSPALEVETQFSVGDAVEQIAVNRSDGIWIGHFDENPLGLHRYSDRGMLTYDFNMSSELRIFDLYAMTLDRADDLWVYPYTEFFLAKIVGDRVTLALEHSPVTGAKAISVDGNHVAFFGNYNSNDVFVLNMDSGKGNPVTIECEGIEPGRRRQIAAHGPNIALLYDERIWRFTLSDLVAVAGV